MKCPSLTEMRESPMVGFVGDLLAAMGVTEDDLPRILPDDFFDRLTDEAATETAMRECMPRVVAKIEAIDGIAS